MGPEWGTEPGDTLDWIKDGSRENVEAVPIDYFFQYAIVDEAGRNAKNHFLVFPERYNDENGNFKWRIKLVVRDWNLRAIKDSTYRLYLLGRYEDNPKPETDEHFPLSEFSVIEFYKGISELEQISNCSSPEHATCQIYSGNRTDAANITTINSGIKNHCAFILHADMLDETHPTYHMTGFLRLYDPASSNNGKYFYISLNFYPKPVVYNIKNVKAPSLHEIGTRCPYCGKIRTNDIKFKGDNRTGKNKVIDCSRYCYSEPIELNGKHYLSCEYNFIGRFYSLNEDGMMKKGQSVDGNEEVYGDFTSDEFKNITESLSNTTSSGMKSIETPNSKLLYQCHFNDGVVITMGGISQSGKSTFVSRMLSVHSEGDYEGAISCDYLENAMKPYVKSIALLKVKTYEMVVRNVNDTPNIRGINGIRLMEDYKSPKYQEFLPSTQNAYYDPVLTHIPFAIELEGIQSNSDKKSIVSFFDLPGGLFSETQGQGQKTLSNLHKDYTMLYRSDSIILLLNFSKWLCDKNDTWVTSEFHMPFLAQIVDKLLTALNKNERAKVVLTCDQQNLEKAQELLCYVLRCIPVKLSNRLTFNTAAKEIALFDICCGKFTEAEVKENGGVIFDIENALADKKGVNNSPIFDNAYAEYICMLERDVDPCNGFENEDDVNALNSRVKEKVLQSKSNRIVSKCKTSDLTVGELVDLANNSKDCFEIIKKQLQKIAEYLCTNYTGFTSYFFQLAPEYKNFYLSFITEKGKCPQWGQEGNIDLLFAKNDGEICNKEYIKCLYDFWLGETRKTVYKNNNDIKMFLFSNYDERFYGSDSLRKAFVEYWNSMSEESLITYLCQGEASV